MGKLAQAMMYGAVTLQIRGNFDDGMQLVKDIAEHAPVTIVNSINPFRLQGQKTAAFEIIEELECAPDYHCLPVGNRGQHHRPLDGLHGVFRARQRQQQADHGGLSPRLVPRPSCVAVR